MWLELDDQKFVERVDIHQAVDIAVVEADSFADYQVDSLVDLELMMAVAHMYFVLDSYMPYEVAVLMLFVVDIDQVVLGLMVVGHTFGAEGIVETEVVDSHLDLDLVVDVMHLDMLLLLLLVDHLLMK